MSYSVSVAPSVVYTGQRITINVDGLDVPGGDTYDFGIIRDGVTVYGYDPATSVIIQERTGPVSVTCREAWLGGGSDAVLTVRAYIWGAQYETADASFRLLKGTYLIPYSIDDDVAALPVSGWLPHDSKRNNLNRLLFAHGVNVIKDPEGDPHFTFLYESSAEPQEIPDTEIYAAGASESYEKPYSAVSVTEHTYTPLTDENPVTLYDNTGEEPVTQAEVWFTQAPIIVSTIEAVDGLTLLIATENNAIVSGSGKLTGIPYTHTARSIEHLAQGGDKEKSARVENCTMVNAINSQNLLDRLSAFYQPEGLIKTIKNSIVFSDQEAGRAYHFAAPFGGTVTAWLTSLSLNASQVFKGNCEWREGYTPAGQAGLYKHCIILDKATFAEDGGVFTVPAEIAEMDEPQMKVVMIGGGTGGSSGFPGMPGKEAKTYTNVSDGADISGKWYGAEGGEGGKPGEGGAPGRVYAVVIRNPTGTFNYTIGDGGEGGEASEPPAGEEEVVTNPGSAGTATTFGEFSSAQYGSYVPKAGVYDPIHGQWYAVKGKNGIRGGKGGARKVGSGDNYSWVTDGADVTGPGGAVYHGGKTGIPLTRIGDLPEARFIAYGGNGAGAAVGLDREEHPEMDGGEDQEATWEVR